MTTIERTRYALGDRLDLLPKGRRPPPRSFYAVNSKRIAMVASRLAQVGEYSQMEEELQARMEKEMVHPCARYGATVNVNARAESEPMDEARRNQIRASQAIRDVSVYGDDSLYSGE